jgi:hypothetical protein
MPFHNRTNTGFDEKKDLRKIQGKNMQSKMRKSAPLP